MTYFREMAGESNRSPGTFVIRPVGIPTCFDAGPTDHVNVWHPGTTERAARRLN